MGKQSGANVWGPTSTIGRVDANLERLLNRWRDNRDDLTVEGCITDLGLFQRDMRKANR